MLDWPKGGNTSVVSTGKMEQQHIEGGRASFCLLLLSKGNKNAVTAPDRNLRFNCSCNYVQVKLSVKPQYFFGTE